jgi:hypothetical protein
MSAPPNPKPGPEPTPWWQHILPLALLAGCLAVIVWGGSLFVGDSVHYLGHYFSEAGRADRWDAAERKRLAGEVSHGAMSFEQAGCEYRGGEWDGRQCVVEP